MIKTGVVGIFDVYPLYATTFCSDIVQTRRNKKKRINKKWRKRYGMKQVPWKNLFLFDGKIYGHPATLEKVVEYISPFPNGDCK